MSTHYNFEIFDFWIVVAFCVCSIQNTQKKYCITAIFYIKRFLCTRILSLSLITVTIQIPDTQNPEIFENQLFWCLEWPLRPKI